MRLDNYSLMLKEWLDFVDDLSQSLVDFYFLTGNAQANNVLGYTVKDKKAQLSYPGLLSIVLTQFSDSYRQT